MEHLPGRRTFSGTLTAADRAVAERHRTMLCTRRAESRRVTRTTEQWRERAIVFGEKPTVQQAALRIVGAVTVFDRRFAVIREVAFAGSSSRSKAFWTTLAARVLWEESCRALPLLVGGARLRAANGTLDRKRTSTSLGWHATERRPVTKCCLAEHIKAHVVAMFVGKEDKNKRDANRCELCTARNNGEPVFHFGSVACLLDAHGRYNFMLVALNLYGSDTQPRARSSRRRRARAPPRARRPTPEARADRPRPFRRFASISSAIHHLPTAATPSRSRSRPPRAHRPVPP